MGKGWVMAGYSRSFKVIYFGSNRNWVCDILLLNNTHLHPIAHSFQDRGVLYWSNFRSRHGAPFFQALVQGKPLN